MTDILNEVFGEFKAECLTLFATYLAVTNGSLKSFPLWLREIDVDIAAAPQISRVLEDLSRERREAFYKVFRRKPLDFSLADECVLCLS
ncbi:MAG: hypothetical protein LBS60_05075 [Deltaproteobacteria bacterium]|nr:hypothetical protein [Deltaproteobacteria bacterium]